jgi:hypothetical protein
MERPALRGLSIVRTSNSGRGHQLDVQRDDLTAASARRPITRASSPRDTERLFDTRTWRGSVLLSCPDTLSRLMIALRDPWMRSPRKHS